MFTYGLRRVLLAALIGDTAFGSNDWEMNV